MRDDIKYLTNDWHHLYHDGEHNDEEELLTVTYLNFLQGNQDESQTDSHHFLPKTHKKEAPMKVRWRDELIYAAVIRDSLECS